MEFSNEQNAIIDAKLTNNLISASAGSGKTTVLTARIGKEVKQAKDGFSVERMLVVTFTEDAASHMAEKIEETLRRMRDEALGDNDQDLVSRLNEQIDLLPNAYIQTMHGFCSRVIKEKGYLLADGINADYADPSCRILGDNERQILLQSAVEYAIKDMYRECQSEDDDFIRLTRRFGDGRTDDAIIPFVTATYLSLRSLPDYLDVCDRMIAEREERDRKKELLSEKDETEIRKVIVDYLIKVRELFNSSDLSAVLDEHPRYRFVKEYTNDEFISEVNAKIDTAVAELNGDSRKNMFMCLAPVMDLGGLSYSNMYSNADLMGDDKPMMAIVTLRRFVSPGKWSEKKYDNPYDLPKEYAQLLLFDPDTVLKNQVEGTRIVKAFVELLKKTDLRFAELKHAMHGMDYSDLEQTAYEILKNEEAASFYREKFIEIFVDEYQDNTELQDKIIDRFDNKEKGNVFRVGDVKQSIYKFRYAAPDNFLKKMKDISSGNMTGNVHYLVENHRSTREVLEFSNFIFEQIMTEDASEIEYDKTNRLMYAKETGNCDVPRIVVADSGDAQDLPEEDDLIVVDDNTKAETKAYLTAVECEVKWYLEECTRPDGTETDFKDICILASSNGQAETIARYLNGCTLKNGRRLEASGRFTTDVFEDMDIHRLINFLICLGNAYRDEYMAGLLLSNYKFSNFTVEELAEIQVFIHELKDVTLDKEPLMLRLRIYADKCDNLLAMRVRNFIEVFDRIRMSAMVTDIDDIIELIYRETGIKATVDARGSSDKFDMFKDWLSESFKKRGSDISGIANELEQMKIHIKKANIEVKDASKNKITTMTVHKSKGLEFPFVILVATGGSDENKDKLQSIMFDRKCGFITEDYDVDNIKRSKSFEQYVYQAKMDLATNAETCRLLYVALTRAEERLSVVTTCNIGDNKKSSPLRKAFLQSVVYDKKTFDRRHWLEGDMTLPYCLFSALARSADAKRLREIADVGDLDPQNVIPFYNLDGNEVKGFEVIPISADKVNELYSAHLAAAAIPEDKKEEPDKAKPEFDGEGRLVLPEYEHQESVDIPFKVSVTGIAGDRKPSETTHVDLEIRSLDDYESANISMLTAANKGTILHRIMRFIDLEGIKTGRTTFEDEIEALISEGYLNICSSDNAREVANTFKDGILAFCRSERCDDIINSFAEGTARSEKPIVFAVYIEGDKGDSALVQGIIDLIYKTSEGYTILDYKTDRLSGVNPGDRAKEASERHAFQLNSYAAACEEEGLKVAHKLLYLVRYGEFVEV